jgi:hypothetical protein
VFGNKNTSKKDPEVAPKPGKYFSVIKGGTIVPSVAYLPLPICKSWYFVSGLREIRNLVLVNKGFD